MLVTEEVREGLDGDFSFSRAGKRKLKGVKEEVALFRARRRNGSSSDDTD